MAGFWRIADLVEVEVRHGQPRGGEEEGHPQGQNGEIKSETAPEGCLVAEVGQLEGAFVQGVLGVEELIQPPHRLPWDEAQHRRRHGEQSYHCRREDHLGG